MTAGRPTLFSQEVVDEICTRLMAGESLRKICVTEGLPKRDTVFKWLISNPVFRAQYEFAREVQAEGYFEEIIDIADEPNLTKKKTRKGGKNIKGEKTEVSTETVIDDNVARSRLRADSRKWVLSRMNPKKYGDRLQQEHTGPDGGPIQVDDVSFTDAERLAAIATLFDTVRTRSTGQNSSDTDDVAAATGTTDGSVSESS